MAGKKKTADAPSPEADNLSSLKLELDDPAPEPEPKEEPKQPVAEQVDDTEPGVDEPSLRPTVARTMRDWGYEVSDDATDDDVRAHLESLEDRASKYEQTQKELAELRAWRAEAERRQIEPEPKPEPAKPEPTAEADDDLGIPDPPKLDKFSLAVLQAAKANGKLTEGVGGMISSDDPSLAPHVEKYNQHVSALEEYNAEWGDPRKVARHIAQKYADSAKSEAAKVRKEFEDWKASQQQNTVQSQIDAYYEKHKAAYFDLDADGNIQFDAQGRPVGARYAECIKAAQEAHDLGITDPLKIHQYVVKHVPPVAPEPKQPQTPEKKRVAFINRLKKNGSDTILTAPVNRPAASASTRDRSHLSPSQQLDAHFSDLMAEKVADRM